MAGELILIVEDNERNMRLVRDLLEFKGYRTLEAENAARAIDLTRSERPDLVLLDVQLPDMDGITALGVIRGDPATAGTKVVALTAFAMAGDRERLLAAGFDAYLAKPIDVQAFPDQVRDLCGEPRDDHR